ncbi:MAG: FAD-dependent oxidoreductase [Myxococcales bacterium]|nr:FAD-dependent oxidoreductase [Myxococcales bacterium]
MARDAHVVVVGAGIFGVSTALELRRRGRRVTLVDRAEIPAADAASSDISKAVRMTYGADLLYTELMEQAREAWLDLQARWQRGGDEPLYHEVGVLVATSQPMRPGSFEHDSYELLRARGHQVERLDEAAMHRRVPAWGAGVDGFFHALGGYAESGRVVARLARDAQAAGVEVRGGYRVAALAERGSRVTGLVDERGHTLLADEVVVAAGAWSPKLLPELAPCLRSTGHALFHFGVDDAVAADYQHERLPFFTADIATTGLYGFPIHPREGVLKLALHDAGAVIDADAPREVSAAHRARVGDGLARYLPALAGLRPRYARLCLYTDSWDGDFWIARHPEREGLAVATGGSGHAFKFAPILGRLVADALEGKTIDRFRWRPELRSARAEAARCVD